MKFINDIKNIDISIIKIMKNGYRIALILSILATYILFLYTYNPISHLWFECGISILRIGITIFSFSFACGFVFDKMRKEII